MNRGSVRYNGTLEIELGGTTPGSGYDQLNHILGAGVADLGGLLEVSLIDGFTPTAGDKFEIITATSVLEVFDTVNLPALPGALSWFVNYGATSVELVSTFGADFDEDGVVDNVDLTTWQTGFGTVLADHMDGDANADATVSGFDFLAWQQQLGNNTASLAELSTSPEPSTGLLLIVAASALAVRRGRSPRG